jgi:tRNA nucleotidyltransferase (CCA-adding enzyme)
MRLDIASCRKETYREPAAYPKVSQGTLRDDLFRRDFTINAMAMALNADRFGVLVDPFHGLRDLTRQRLRILHAKSFLDDPSRILRAARLAPRFHLHLEQRTARKVSWALARGLLGRLNRGRLRKEFERMAAEPNPRACLACLGRWLEASSNVRSGKLEVGSRK